MQGTHLSSSCVDTQISTCSFPEFDRDITSGFSHRFIRLKANQLIGKVGFTIADRPDIEQELALALFQRLPQFDPKRGNWEAFAVMVVHRYVATLIRLQLRAKRLARNIVSINAPLASANAQGASISSQLEQRHASALTGRTSWNIAEQVELSVDAKAVVASLPAELRYLCYRLQFETIAEVATRLGVSRTTIYERISRIRRAFVRAGFPSRIPVRHVPIQRRYKHRNDDFDS